MTACLRVSLGDERYAVPIDHVREVAELGELVAVPGAGPHVVGIRHLHGELLPVVRLDGMLRAPPCNPRRMLVVEDGTRRAGFAVDAAEQVEELPEPHPLADATDRPSDRLTLGAVLHDGRMIGVLDVAALLDAVTASVA